MTENSKIVQRAEQAIEKKAAYGRDIDLSSFADQSEQHNAIDPQEISDQQKKSLEAIGVDVSGANRSGTFMQMDHSVVHCNVTNDGVEMLSIDEALRRHGWLMDYWWKAVQPDADKYTARAAIHQEHGYFIRALPNAKIEFPLQACMYIGQEGVVQDVHNIIIVEEGAELNVITGCATDPVVNKGMHIGVSEFYVKKGGKLSFTMIHRWGEEVVVRPRTGVVLEEDAQYLSNFICMHKVNDLQMYPTVRLAGEGAVARMNSILVAVPGSHMDIGGRAVMDVPGTKAELITRSISTGGIIINRGHLLAGAENVKAHLECHGLLLQKDGVIHAIPELEARTDNAELSHEAAVGKIAQEEIEYLMARGLDEEEATATIVRGFLNVNIEGLPESLQKEIDIAVNEFSFGKGA